MSIRPLLALVTFLLLAALGVLWYTFSDPSAGSREPALSAPGTEGLEVPRDESAELIPPPEPRPEPVSEASEPEREAVAIAETEKGGFAIPGDALWIEGRVIFPAGTPFDEQLSVEASGRRFTKDRKSPRRHKVDVESNGRFRVAFSAETKKGFIGLSGCFLYLEGKQKVDLKKQEGEVKLEPLLGGLIVGRLLLPPGETASEETFESVMLSAQNRGSNRDRVRRSAKPDPDGRFEITGLPPGGKYHLDLSSTVFSNSWKEGIVVTAGEITEIELTLVRGVRLAGRITGTDGEGLKGAELELEVHVETKGRSSTTSTQRRSIENGAFEFTGLQPGAVTLRIRAEGCSERVEELGSFEAGAARDDLHFQVSAGLTLRGSVLWPDGTPAVGVAVHVQHVLAENEDSWDAREFHAKTDAEGDFRITGLEARPAILTASARRELPIRDEGAGAGDSSGKKRRPRRGPVWKGEQKDLTPGTEGVIVILSPGDTVRGRVTDDTGAPVTSYQVQATPRRGGGGNSSFDWSRQISGRARDENGEFELAGLSAGEWRVHVSGDGFVGSDPVVVTIPTDVPLDLRVRRAVRLVGVVQDPSGQPVGGAEIDLTQRDGPQGTILSVTSTAHRDGSFTLDDAPPGSLTLYAEAPGWARSNGLELEVSPGEEREGLLLVLRPGARLTGEIHTSAKPFDGRRIYVSGREGVDFWESTYSDKQGRFSFEGLPQGEFNVRLDPPPSAEGDDDHRLRAAKQHKAVVTLTEGGTAHVVLGEPSASAILVHGRVTVGGEPMPDLVVRCGASEFNTAAACDEFGNYELKVDGPGSYWFTVTARDGDRATFSRELGAEASQRVDFDLAVGSIAGIVLGPGAEPVAKTSVLLERKDEKNGESRPVAGTDSDSDGSFRFGFLGPGRYRLRAGGPDWSDATVNLASTVTDEVVLEEGRALSGLVIELRPGGILTGVVTHPDGSRIGHVWLTLKDGDGREVTQAGVRCNPDDGVYVLSGIPPGTFTVSGSTQAGESAAVTVKFSSGATSRADLVIVE